MITQRIETLARHIARELRVCGLMNIQLAIKEKAAAWREFNDAARLQTILEKLPAISHGDKRILLIAGEPVPY